ncbi:platelet glycoprotein Ib alpha chain-like [Asterias rubens]|uniref:platelet glycoprotein Ib alpha chain-like n=1 Tax=Asterias rubens TaxID=7604 RepID=UPI001455416B|nr:platelet glycoprotein Ib alpha chain-like [Asterias rubens]
MQIIVGLLVLVVGMPYSNAVECLSKWNAIGNQCYYANPTATYTSLTWATARQTCLKMGADLPVIDTAAEFDALYTLTEVLSNNAWLGCNSSSWEKFTCVDHDSFYNSENSRGHWPWKEGQPSSMASSQCLVLNVVDELGNGVLTSLSCGSLLSSTILCEQAPTNTQYNVITTDPAMTDVPSTLGQAQPEPTRVATTEGSTETYRTTYHVLTRAGTAPLVTSAVVTTDVVTSEVVIREGGTSEGGTSKGVTSNGVTSEVVTSEEVTTKTLFTGETTSPVTSTAPQNLDQILAEPSSELNTRVQTEMSTVVSTTSTGGKSPVETTQVKAPEPSDKVTVHSSSPNEESGTCYVMMEPDPESNNRARWLVPQPDPCLCKRIRLGGINTQTTARQYPVKFMDTVVVGRDPVEIRNWLGCQNRE